MFQILSYLVDYLVVSGPHAVTAEPTTSREKSSPHKREIIASTSPHHNQREMGAGLCFTNDAPTARVFHAEDIR